MAKLVHGLRRDVTIKVYPGGINAEFVEGCDYIPDEIGPSFKARYDRHRAFRRVEPRCPFLLTTYAFGNRSFFWNMSVEEYLGLTEGADVTNKETARQLVSREEVTCLSWRVAPPMAQGLFTERVMLAMTSIEKLASGCQAVSLVGLRDGRVANLGDEDGAGQMAVSAMREFR